MEFRPKRSQRTRGRQFHQLKDMIHANDTTKILISLGECRRAFRQDSVTLGPRKWSQTISFGATELSTGTHHFNYRTHAITTYP